MSFDSEYWELQRKRKKKEEEEKKSTSNKTSKKPYASRLISPADEIAPVRTFKSASTTAQTVAPSKKDDDERTWFKKGSGNIVNTILGTTVDVVEDLGTGIIGMGEKAVDFLAMVGTAMGNAQMQQNMNDAVAFSAVSNIGKDKKTKEKAVENIINFHSTAQNAAKKGTTEFVKKDLYDESKIAKKIITTPFQMATDINVEESSVLGDKSDALLQSGGQLLATAGLQALGVPWFLTTGATSFGAEAENAFNQGATFEQATMSAAISAGAEILTEKLSGGIKFGGKTLDDVLLKPLTERISGKVAKKLVTLGIDALGEGAEEVVSGIFSNLGSALYKEENISELLFSEEAVDEYIESFIGGMALGGFSSGVRAVANRNAIELDEDEQKVFDKVVEDRIAEATKDGKTLSKREESAIRKDVLNGLLKGYIDTDTIESVLGGEEYETYKAEKDKIDGAIASGNELLSDLRQTLKTITDEGQQAEIENRIQQTKDILEKLKNNENLGNLKSKLGQNVFDLVKDSRLSESYREIARHKQNFEADTEQYENEYAKRTAQNAINYRNDEGHGLDNTNASHDFIDLMTKYSADREVEVVFTTTKGLAELKKNGNKYGIKPDPKEINAFVSKEHKKVFINMDTGMNLYSLVGHEVTHTTEAAKHYGDLLESVKSFVGKKEFNEIYKKKAKTYEDYNLTKLEIEQEIVADFCGERLLTDYDFVKHLAVNNQNIFQKAWDSIKHLYKMATAGSKEARQLERVKRNFEKAYKEAAKTGAKVKGTKNSLSEEQEAYFKDSKVRDENGNLKVMYHGTSKGGHTVFDTYGSKYGLFGQGSYFTDNKSVAESYTNKGKGDNKQVYETYLNITNPIDMDAEADVNAWAKALPEADFSNCTTNEDCYRAMEEYFEDEQYSKYEASEIAIDVIQGMGYDGITHIGGGRVNAEGTRHQVYIAFEPEQIKNIDNIAPTKDADIRYSLSENIEAVESYSDTGEGRSIFRTDWLQKNQLMVDKIVKNRGKIKTDSFKSWFGKSEALNQSGEPLLVFHGTKSRFTKFTSGGKPVWFCANPMVAEAYSDITKATDKIMPSGKVFGGATNRVIPAYIRAENPADFGNTDLSFEDALLGVSRNLGISEEELSDVWEKVGKPNELWKVVHSSEMTDLLKKYGFDSVKAIERGSPTWGVFESNQAKSAVANKGSFGLENNDVRYSLSETDNKYLSAVESGDTETAQRMVDEVAKKSGYTIKAYHGTGYNFTVFDESKQGSNYEDWGRLGKGFYFAPNERDAKLWAERSRGDDTKVIGVYLKDQNLINAYDALPENLVETIPDDWDSLTKRLASKYTYNYIEYMQEKGYDVQKIMREKGYAGVVASDTEYVMFNAEDIKSADTTTYDDNGNVIPLSERFKAENNDIRYSLGDTLEKNGKILYNNSPLSTDNRAKTNNNSSIKWVYDAEIFSVTESKLFHSKISEINQGSEAFSKNSAGEYMIPIENKIVFTDGNYDSPYAREIVEVLTEYQTEFDDIRERIYNVEKGKSDKYETAQILAKVYGNGIVIAYRNGISGVYGWENGQRKGKTRRTVVRNYLNKQNRARNDRTSQEAPINEIAPIEASSTDGVFFDAKETKFSLSEDSNGRKLSKEQQDYFKNVSPLLKDESGNIKRYYHGTARGDRVGTYFNPERATSGPMAFFTDNPEIAENYSKSKADTSMSYDSDYDSYETQFRAKVKGMDMPLINAWRYLPMDARARIKDRAEHTHYDWDDYETLIYDEETTEAGGGFSWQLREARGNVFQALNEQWLNSGNLFNEEGKYIDVLKFIGVFDEFEKLGYGEPYYKDPYYREEKVFEVYLNVTNPFHTADVDEEFLNDARDWVDNTDLSIYESETADSDLWDKRSLDPYEWLDRLESDIENKTTHAWTSIPDVITDFLKEYGGYDGIVDAGGKHTGYGHQVVIPFYSEQIKNIDNETPTTDVHIDLSLSGEGEIFKDYGNLKAYAKDITVSNDIAPIQETAESSVSEPTAQSVAPIVSEDDYAPMTEEQALRNAEEDRDYVNSFTDADMPPEMDAPIYSADTSSVDEKALKNISAMAKDILFLTPRERRAIEDVVQKYSTSESQNEAELFNEIKRLFGEKSWSERIEEVYEIQGALKGYKINVSPFIKRDITDYTRFMRSNFGKIAFSKEGMPVDTAYMELSSTYPNFFPSDIVNPTDQLLQMADVANMTKDETRTAELDDDIIQEATDVITEAVNSYKEKQLLKSAERDNKAALRDELKKEREAQKEAKPTRAKLHNSIIEKIKTKFAEKGFDFDEVLNKAKNLSTIATVDNTPQRVMEKALGYKQGQALADETVNKVAQNESEGIKWLNSFTDRKNGVLAQISKQYNIKPGSKKSAAAQMYAEGFYVDKNNEIIEYGDRELAIDFPDVKVQENIKGLARDPRIRKIYDDTLNAINESRSRNLYPEIPRLDNYFLHFRAMEDTFSQLGLPFNPNDIRAKDLPTDLNGVTADLKPGQPYFASAKHREGMRTSFDLLGGLERYLSSAKNQIYHIDDIQTLRALRNYIADTYGQAKGLESLDDLTDEEAQYRIEQVYSSHLSTFAKFLNEEANVLAGKTSLIDRGAEGVMGRKAFTFFDTLNKQVGSNMVGWNISSSLTNFLPVAQTFAKTNKFDFTKAFAQTVSSKIGSIFGKTDSFVENNPTIIRRKGAERFYRTPFQKIGDTGYLFMSAVDDISTELIVRTKYNELVRKGMDEQKASFEADKWVSRLMGDRSLGQQPQLYNSKILGLLTKFQLEVRNQLDSQFYDTIQEAKVSNEEIENKLLKNAKTAAKVTSVFFQLAAVQHLYGMAFESIAGYNPAFDIIDVLIKTLGFDDDEEDEDTPLDNLWEGLYALAEDLPYASLLVGSGRIPISSALPVKQLWTGKDKYGNEKSRIETLKETAPYYLLPTGYGQIKKTAQGLGMFSDKHPVAGSYTDSGNLRFPVDDTLLNRVQAGVFGQYANENARTYFDEGYAPLKEKQIQEYIDVEMPIKDYWQYREDIKDLDTLEEKFDFVAGMDLPVEKKNILINNIVDRKEKVDLENYDDFENYEEFDFYAKNTEKYNFLQDNGVSYKEYKADEDTKEKYDSVYSWWKNYPEKVTVSKAVTDNVIEYRGYTSDLDDIRADKDENGKSISGSAKEKKKAYIWGLDIDEGAKYILFKNEYKADDTYNYEIIDYLNSRDDISYDEMNTICEELGFKVNRETGYISWD